jgi:predicted SAM-dependent methyltransferase
MMINETKIDLACGNSKREGFIGIDIAQTDSTDYIVDLTKYPWPIESNSVEELNCSHYIEHIPHDVNNPNDTRDGLIQFMDECYRILKSEGKLRIIVPFLTSVRAFQDPTHQRFICKETFQYFNQEWIKAWNLEHYNIKSNFNAVFSYFISNELVLKSKEIREQAFNKDWNAIDDLLVDLIKI